MARIGSSASSSERREENDFLAPTQMTPTNHQFLLQSFLDAVGGLRWRRGGSTNVKEALTVSLVDSNVVHRVRQSSTGQITRAIGHGHL